MHARAISERITWMGAVDWERRLFDALIPLPDGTSYNAYLVRGKDKIALFDTVEPEKLHVLLDQLKDVPHLDYVIAHHAEQDHSGAIPEILKRYPKAKLLATAKGIAMLRDLMDIPEERCQAVKDGETLDLGGLTVEFLFMPWVHWPETMVSYLREEKTLLSCDFFGSHLATNALYAVDKSRVLESAKRYYAEIMMPFAAQIAKHLQRLENYELRVIAPSHGPVYDDPALIVNAYKEWVTGAPKNLVALPYVSMHGSTRAMVEILTAELTARKVPVEVMDLTSGDIGKLAMTLVDAATVVLGTPTVLFGPHPAAAYAAILANALKPKTRHVSVIGSLGWGGKMVEQLGGMLGNLKVEFLPMVLAQGIPRQKTREELAALAETIAKKHEGLAHPWV